MIGFGKNQADYMIYDKERSEQGNIGPCYTVNTIGSRMLIPK